MWYKKILNVCTFLSVGFLAASCEDVVNIDAPKADPLMVVDAWLTNVESDTQFVKLRETLSYFDNNELPPLKNAEVTLTNSKGQTFSFIDTKGTGDYIYLHPQGQNFGTIGDTFTLTIKNGDDVYTAESELRRVAPIDSIGYEYDEVTIGDFKGYFAQVYAFDPKGQGDCAWIRSYVNGKKQEVLNITYDAATSVGANVDSALFVFPVRIGIIDEALEVNDTLTVEILSITPEGFKFWEEMRIQLANGGLFATPLANVRTNIKAQTPNPKKKAVGFFSISEISRMGVRIRE